MRAVRVANSMTHHSTPLVVRASLPKTFRGFGVFAEASLSFLGIYLLIEVLKEPLEADQSTVLLAGVLLSLATILLFYLIGPSRFPALARHDGHHSRGGIRIERSQTLRGDSLQAQQIAEKAIEKERLPGSM